MKRYTNIPTIPSPNNKRMYASVRYPSIPRSFDDVYVYTTIGDRFDSLAQQFYGDSSLWWIISIANDNLKQDSLTPPLGSQIRIPSNPSPIIAKYNSLNSPVSVSSGTGGGSNNGY